MALIEEFVIWGRKGEFVTNDALLVELKKRGFEPQVVGEIDPPPKGGGSWVLRDKRDRRSHEDGGVWITWARSKGAGRRDDAVVKYVVETFDGRSGYDWFLSVATASAIAHASEGVVSADEAPDQDAATFDAAMAKDPSTRFHGPESVTDWESQNLDEDFEEGEEDDDEDEDLEDEDEDEDLEDEDEEDLDEDEDEEEDEEDDEDEDDLDEDEDEEDDEDYDEDEDDLEDEDDEDE